MQRLQDLGLLRQFHPFGNGVEAERSAQVDDRPDDGCVAGSGVDIVDEGLVNLEYVDLQVPKVVERRVATAEVVDG